VVLGAVQNFIMVSSPRAKAMEARKIMGKTERATNLAIPKNCFEGKPNKMAWKRVLI